MQIHPSGDWLLLCVRCSRYWEVSGYVDPGILNQYVDIIGGIPGMIHKTLCSACEGVDNSQKSIEFG